jgi:DNA-binding beta-propeller fold protein YncE
MQMTYGLRHEALAALMRGALMLGMLASGTWAAETDYDSSAAHRSDFLTFSAPAGERPATTETSIDGLKAAILPNGRLITPAGTEVNVGAPKPFGLALSPDGKMLATLNSGARPFSLTLITELTSPAPTVKRIDVNASFMGVTFSPDSKRVYLSGGENGNIWVGDTTTGSIMGSVNLNSPTHPLDRPLDVVKDPQRRFKGAFPGNMALSHEGRYLYVVEQGGFQVHVIDVAKIQTGVDDQGRITEPDNFAAVISSVKVGRYPFGITLSPDDRTLLVTHVGVFEYTHLRPENPTGDDNIDYPLCYPGAGYPDETQDDRLIEIQKVNPRALPSDLRLQQAIRCGYIPADLSYTVPGLGSPNAPESSSVYVLDVSTPDSPVQLEIVKTGPLVGEFEAGIEVYSGSHPNAVVVGPQAIYVANGNNDSISILHRETYAKLGRINLSLLRGFDRRLKGVQPVGLALSPDGQYLYVAEAGVNAVGVIKLTDQQGQLLGHIPTGWWPSSVRVSADGRTLYVANARGRGAGPNPVGENNSPKYSVLGTVNLIPTPTEEQLEAYTARVYANNGFVDSGLAQDDSSPVLSQPGRPSSQIKHIIFSMPREQTRSGWC